MRKNMDRRGGKINQIKRVLFWQDLRRMAKPQGLKVRDGQSNKETFRGISVFSV